MAWYIAKNIVAAGLADTCEVQLSYDVGVAEPIAVLINTEGASKISEKKLSQIVRKLFPLKSRQMIDHLKLARPIFAQTSYGGHFGRALPNFNWEKTDMVNKLRKEAGLTRKK
jgi:S-adenosylmethionine synthetase